MTRIGGSGQPPPSSVDKPSETRPQEGTRPETSAHEAGSDKKLVDSFERAAPQLAQRLEQMAGKKAVAGSVRFTSEHLAQVAAAFAGMLRKTPGADRRARARMFAKAILRSRKFGKIFNEADEQELEKIYDLIGGQLDGSPVLAQLVEEVTEGARKMKLG